MEEQLWKTLLPNLQLHENTGSTSARSLLQWEMGSMKASPKLAQAWLKMEGLSFEGLRLALVDPESRLCHGPTPLSDPSVPVIRKVRARKLDFFEEIELELHPNLTTLIGGRGCGKSTLLECLRFALDRARPEDFQSDEKDIQTSLQRLRNRRKKVRDFGETAGMFLPGHEIQLEIEVAGQSYQVTWEMSDNQPRVETLDEASSLGALDVRALLAPRILSQGQISRIARDPGAQRRELDALENPEILREHESKLQKLLKKTKTLQIEYQRLLELQESLPLRETELKTLEDRIRLLEKGSSTQVLERHRSFQKEARWLESLQDQLETLSNSLENWSVHALRLPEAVGPPPNGPSREWLNLALQQSRQALEEAASGLNLQASQLRRIRADLRSEQDRDWKAEKNQTEDAYRQLQQEMLSQGVDFTQHAQLLKRRADLEREVLRLRELSEPLRLVQEQLFDVRNHRLQLCRERQERRLRLARSLENQNADVRMEVLPFGDRQELLKKKDAWFSGSGLREQDWELLVDWIQPGPDAPERLFLLTRALRQDSEQSLKTGESLEAESSRTAALLGKEVSNQLSRYFFRALAQPEKLNLDQLEQYLPEDFVEARVRSADGKFKPISQGSIGQRSTAVLSLLLSAGKQPLIIDQPEDDLDNQYIYSVVVSLLRRSKLSRQIILATHNANLPVNGDAELIIALGVDSEQRLGHILASGSIDRPEIKAQVSSIMEGSREAFRLRQERYGF